VHGQIIATWVPHLRLQRIIVANDLSPENPLQKMVFRMAIPTKIAFETFNLEETATWLSTRGASEERCLILFENLKDARRLFEKQPFSQLNIGNVHHGQGRRAFTNAVYLGDEEIEDLKGLMARGLRAEIKSLPSDPSMDLRKLL